MITQSTDVLHRTRRSAARYSDHVRARLVAETPVRRGTQGIDGFRSGGALRARPRARWRIAPLRRVRS
jgi:hypothetical protein